MKDKTRNLLLIGVVLGLVALALVFFPRNTSRRNALASRALATQVLAEYLAGKFPGQRALIVANPFTVQRGRRAEVYQFEQAGIDGLRRGFGKDVQLVGVAFPELRREVLENPASIQLPVPTTTPLSYLVAENSFDILMKQNPSTEIIVSLIGLPNGVTETELWKNPKMPKLGLLLPDWRVLGDPQLVTQAIRSGKIAAAVLNKPGAPAENAPPGNDSRAAFAERFLLVTADSLDDLLRQYPKLF
ncbi:MAG: hypothetical protein HY043_21375 [Verrucomicrobia bacterium]|nr:hypothetical protein [Verrucomicrobiota bacterium]